MPDNEIIKALECCVYDDYAKCHFGCPYKTNCQHLTKDALDLINRQKAEIERLKSMNQAKLDTIHDLQHDLQAEIKGLEEDRNNYQNLYCLTVEDLDTAKAEAIKEFAEKLKNKVIVDLFCGVDSADYLDDILFKDIDNLVNKMVGENNGNLQ